MGRVFDMEPLGFKTDKLSWSLLMSCLRRVQSPEVRIPEVDLNLEAAPCVVLCCIAVEAFVNEISTLSHSFLFDRERDRRTGRSTPGVADDILRKVSDIRMDRHGSFYDRYRGLLGAIGIDNPLFLADLSTLGKVRDSLVHFRDCDVPIIDDEDGVIRHGQKLPPTVAALQSKDYEAAGVLAPGTGTAWTLRLATDAMAAWSLDLAFNAAMYILDHLPPGEYRDAIWKAYAHRDKSFPVLFARGKSDLATWWSTTRQQ